MAEQLCIVKGRFLLSINDVPDIRRIFAPLHQMPLKVTYTINKASGTGSRPELGELLIPSCDLT